MNNLTLAALIAVFLVSCGIASEMTYQDEVRAASFKMPAEPVRR